MELTVILLKRGLLSVLSNFSSEEFGKTYPKLFLQAIWIMRIMRMYVNKKTLHWLMRQGGMDGTSIWYCMKVRYESVDKLQPLK